MAVTQADIDELNRAIATGERMVVLNGQSVTYRSIADLILARDDLQRQLTAAAGGTPRKQFYAYHAGRGFK